MFEQAREVLGFFDSLIEILGGVAIIIGIILAVLGYLKSLLPESRAKRAHHVHIEDLRLRLGRYLGLGLDFLIAADILKTVVSPSIQNLILLGGVVVVRMLLTIFLSREIEHLAKLEERIER